MRTATLSSTGHAGAVVDAHGAAALLDDEKVAVKPAIIVPTKKREPIRDRLCVGRLT